MKKLDVSSSVDDNFFKKSIKNTIGDEVKLPNKKSFIMRR